MQQLHALTVAHIIFNIWPLHPALLCSFSWILTRFCTIDIIRDLGDSMVSIHEKEQSKVEWREQILKMMCTTVKARSKKIIFDLNYQHLLDVAPKNWFFVTFTMCWFYILEFCILFCLHFVVFAFYLICILSCLHFFEFAFCHICNMLVFAFCHICILSCLHCVI